MDLSLNKYYEKLEERTLFPLHAGLYKLNEIKGHLEEYLAELHRIEDYTQSKRYAIPTMTHCTPSDMTDWLKEIPNSIIETMGCDILPSISALKRDSVPHHLITWLLEKYSRQISSLVIDCTTESGNPKHLIERAYKITEEILDWLVIFGHDFYD